MKKYDVLWFFVLIFLVAALPGQIKKDKGTFEERKPGYWKTIQQGIEEFEKKEKPKKKKFVADLSNYDLPDTVSEFTQFWHNPPISQGNTGTCWSFATTSFFESEIKRIHNKEIKLSEIYTVYWEYVEKVRRFVRERGNSAIGQGSEHNAVIRMWKKYGCVPADAYSGMKPGQQFHNHSNMFKEIKSYLKFVEKHSAWNEEEVIATVKSIMNHYLGEPPTTFKYQGKTYTPQDFLKKVVRLNLDDYVELMSLKEKPYYKMVEYDVPDNWWNSEDYFNVPLDDFMAVMKKAVRNGYSVCLGGDVSEAGYNSWHDVAIVPTFDIPSEYIDEDARQFRFSNGSTTDDHAIHCVGWLEKDGVDWYLIKDSGSGSRNGKNFGYYFYHEDYVKLKMMNILVHKDMVTELLKKLEK
ncbi:MAG: C1 family peptidase [Calditrichia bacterium]